MPESLPLDLLLAAFVLNDLLYHLYSAINKKLFMGRWRPFTDLLLNLSFVTGCFSALFLAYNYWQVTSWYWPIVLFLILQVTTLIFEMIVDGLLGNTRARAVFLSILGLVGWPFAAIWVYNSIQGIA